MFMKNIQPVTSVEIDSVWGTADFGTISRETVVREGLLKCAAGYHNGRTATSILQELRLITGTYRLTVRGRYMLYEYFKQSTCPRCRKTKRLYICEDCYTSLVVPNL